MLKTNNQEYTEPLQEFVDGIKDFTPTDNDDNHQISRQRAADLVYVAFDSDLNNNEPVPTDRKTRKVMREFLPLALDIIKQESDGDKDLEKELQTKFIHTIGRAGVLPETVRILEGIAPKKPVQDKPEQPTADYTPKVSSGDKQYLENFVTDIETNGRWSSETTKKAAMGFLDIYHPAETLASNNRGTHQEILNAIATCGTYSHAIATALSHLPTLEQTSRIDDIKSEIMKELMIRANPAELRELSRYDEYTQDSVPEIREFTGAIKGAQYEILAHDALLKLGLDNLQYSTLEEDITNGYDLVLQQNGKKYYVDIKAARSFKRSVDKYHAGTTVSGTKERGYVVRKTNHKDEGNNNINIIVVDAETTGSIQYKRNRLQLNTPEKYQYAIIEGMALVDNITK